METTEAFNASQQQDQDRLQQAEAAASSSEMAHLAQRSAAMGPMEQQIGQTMQQPLPQRAAPQAMPSAPSGPIIDPKDFQQFSYGLLAMALIGGKAAKGNWMGVAKAMQGSLQGYMQGNIAVGQQKQQEYENHYKEAIERERRADREFEDLMKRRDISIREMFTHYDLLAHKYDRIDAQDAVRRKDIQGMYKAIGQRQQAREKLEKDYDKLSEDMRHHHETERENRQREADRRAMHEENMADRAAILGKPFEVTGPDGKPALVQMDKHGNVVPVKGSWTPKEKLSVAEERGTANYTTMKQASDVLDKLSEKGTTTMAFLSTINRDSDGVLTAAGRLGVRKALSPQEQQIAQAALQFAEGAGHLKSGARITNQTMKIITDLYLPMPGDSKEVIEQKRNARLNDLEAAQVMGGRGIDIMERNRHQGQPADKPGAAADYSHLWK